ncbi:MAG: trigger factor, partial [Pseudomonadota bacterium]|nr:trigger factor [Pseudomonadota bacterium]
MQLIETTRDGLKRGYEVTIKAVELDNRVVEKLEQSRDQIQVKGFRKGQA